jgi:hypothetical protein
MSMRLAYIQSHLQCVVQFNKFGSRKDSHIIGEFRFTHAHKVVAHDPAWMLESFVGAHCDLSGQSCTVGKDGSANDGGETGVDHCLAAYNREDPILLRIATRFEDPVQFSSSHAWASIFEGLIFHHVGGL